LINAVVEEEAVAHAEESDASMNLEEQEKEKEPVPEVPLAQQILQAQEELARIASVLSENPEENADLFKSLSIIADTGNDTIKKLALVTQLAVYRDVIPGYRIRPLTEEEQKIKVSQEVRRIRRYEQAMVAGYQSFVKDLTRLAKVRGRQSTKASTGLADVAISCACELLVSVPHFNFRGDLLKVLVDKLSILNVDQMFVKCRETLETVFQNDEDGRISLDAISLLTRMMKARNYFVDESVLNSFLHLRLLTEFTHQASRNTVDRKKTIEAAHGKKSKKEKLKFRTKKEKKIAKEDKVVDKDLREADAVVSNEERDALQAETLKMVFVTYFRILKARSPRLMGAVLEGLAKYAHLINQDVFGDLLEALKDLIGHAEADEDTTGILSEEIGDAAFGRDTSRESLLCVVTAFALLNGQYSSYIQSLALDLSFFTNYLYRSILPLSMNPDIELGKNALRLRDPDAPTTNDNKVNISTTTVLLLRSLQAVLLPSSNTRAVPPNRVAAFTKTMLTSSLHLPEKSAQASLGLLNRVAKTHGRKTAFLWNTDERKGDGIFDGVHPDPEGCNASAATAWEGEILRMHFSPAVRSEMAGLVKSINEVIEHS
jgi:nucleolar complex protein 3